jgi:hypothetical protein
MVPQPYMLPKLNLLNGNSVSVNYGYLGKSTANEIIQKLREIILFKIHNLHIGMGMNM